LTLNSKDGEGEYVPTPIKNVVKTQSTKYTFNMHTGVCSAADNSGNVLSVKDDGSTVVRSDAATIEDAQESCILSPKSLYSSLGIFIIRPDGSGYELVRDSQAQRWAQLQPTLVTESMDSYPSAQCVNIIREETLAVHHPRKEDVVMQVPKIVYYRQVR
jgi:hypothetical protein